MKLTRDTRHDRDQASNEQQEPIDEGTKNSTAHKPPLGLFDIIKDAVEPTIGI